MIFNTAVSKINPLGYLLRPCSRIFQILKNEGLPGLAIYLKDRLGVRARLLIIASLIIIPAVLTLFFIKKYAVNVSSYDDLPVASLFDKVYTGHLSFADLFTQQNEHRAPFSVLVLLSLGVLTHHNTVVGCYFNWFLICLTACMFLAVLIEEFGAKKTTFIAFIPIVWLLFNWRQSENLLHSYIVSFFLVSLFFLFAMYLLAKSNGLRWRFALSVACGVISTFSLGNGLLVWPIGLILIILICRSQPKESRHLYLKMASIWCLVGIAVFISYFSGYHKTAGGVPGQGWIQHPLPSLLFFVGFVGNLFDIHRYWAYGVGLILLTLYAYAGVTIVFQNKVRVSTALALSAILFALGSAVLTSSEYANIFLGFDLALRSKYTTFTILGIVGLYFAIISLKTKYRWVKPHLLGILTFLIILGIPLSYVNGIKEGRDTYNWSKIQAYVLSNYRVQSDEMVANLQWPPDLQLVEKTAQILEKYKLNVFSRPSLKPWDLTLVEGSTQSHIDSINFRQPSQQGDSYIISISQQEESLLILGWAVDQPAQKTAGGVFVSIDGQIDIPLLYGGDRPDVAAYLKDSRYRFSGFATWLATSVVGHGQHVLSFKIVTNDKKGYYESDQKIIVEVR